MGSERTRTVEDIGGGSTCASITTEVEVARAGCDGSRCPIGLSSITGDTVEKMLNNKTTKLNIWYIFSLL